MPDALPTVLVPGLNCSARLFLPQIPVLWRFGPVTVGDHTRDETMPAIARRILKDAPPRFALAGLSMGGYLAFEMWRQAPERIAKLALLDTSARPERPEQRAMRDERLAMVRAGRFAEMSEQWFPTFMHRSLRNDPALRGEIRLMNAEVGAEAYVRQQQAIRGRGDFRPDLAHINCPTLVLVGDSDEGTTPEMAREMAGGIPGARLVIVPECGHLSTMERPEAVNRALVEWLGG